MDVCSDTLYQTWWDHYKYEITVAMTVSTRTFQDQARPNPSMDRVGSHGLLAPLSVELSAIDGCWGRETRLFPHTFWVYTGSKSEILLWALKDTAGFVFPY